jgi:peptidoglycan/xylan/chitin deacetylase (PgdA/CDA1 family)
MTKKFALRILQSCGVFALARSMSARMARILLYHNFSGSGEANAGEVTVSAARTQLEYLHRHFHIVPLSHLIEQLGSGVPLQSHTVALTIDDGRRNCYEFFFPLLKEFGMPATFFVVSSFIRREDWVWTDKVLWLSEQPLPLSELGPDKIGDCFKELNQMRPEVRDARIKSIAAQMGASIPKEPPLKYAPCSWNELREMADSGLVEIGSHGVTHSPLASLTERESWQELTVSRAQIEEGLGRDVRSFCFPNGKQSDYRPSHLQQVKEAGYAGAVVARFGLVGNRANPYELPRIGVSGKSDDLSFSKDVDGAEFFQGKLAQSLGRYSPKYQSKHTDEQVFGWSEASRLKDLTVADVSLGFKGRKPGVAHARLPRPQELRLPEKLSRTMRWFPAYAWQRVSRRAPSGSVHLMIAIADHFEPSIVPHDGFARAPYDEQEHRVERWCREYPRIFDSWRDDDGRPLAHTYFYPAEQYDKGLLQQLARHCEAGWGEIETHLHHGMTGPDTEENTRRQLLEFRDTLAFEHGSLSYLDGVGPPRYGFVHGNFALANTEGGIYCGVDSEMQVLAETGCYADFTMPPGPFYRSHVAKINSLYECSVPLSRRGAHRSGRDLEAGRPPKIFPLMVEGPLMMNLVRPGGRLIGVENGAIASKNSPSMHRLKVWKQAGIAVKGRPDWLFIKLQCHGMDPRDREVMLGALMVRFLRDLIEGARQRSETIHFVSAREMVNVILAACDGREGNPGDYRDYRLKRARSAPAQSTFLDAATQVPKS